MKSRVLIASLSLLFAAPALALDANSCAAKSAQLKPSERNAYMQSCLAQVSSPANVKEVELQHKRATCEQNAKNQKLQGNEKAGYISTCMNENEAAAAKAATPTEAKVEHKQEKKKLAKSAPADDQAKPKAKAKAKAKAKHDKKHEAPASM